MIYGIGLPRTGTTSLGKALQILKIEHEVGDYMFFRDKDKLNGKFILTIRIDSETWWKSVCNKTSCVRHNKMIMEQRVKMYGYKIPDKHKEHFMKLYEKHNSEMMKYNPLVVCWECGDGWGELCEFLRVDIPDCEFPHLNSSK